LPFNQAYIM